MPEQRPHKWLSAGLALAAALVMTTTASAEQRLKTVATFSILADFVRNVGGDLVEVKSLVGPNGNSHVYTPTPADAQALAGAQVIFMNGLGFEGWMSRLIAAAGTRATVVTATNGIQPIKRGGSAEAHGSTHREDGHDDGARANDPHAWQSVTNAKIYVDNIRNALIAADPERRTTYEANATAYLTKLDMLDAEIRSAIDRIAPDRRRVVTPHRAFEYFGQAYGVTFFAPESASIEANAAARDVAALIERIKRDRIAAVFLENVSDPRLLERISHESGAKVGGTLFSDALSDPDGPAPTYIELMRHNLRQFIAVLPTS